MTSILNTVLPVFGMIMLGFAFGKAGIIDQVAGRGISLFVFNAAIPALLFKTVAGLDADGGAPWGLWIVFFGGLAITWIATAIASRFVPSLEASGGAAASMAAGFGNLAMLGTPLALAHFGSSVALPLGMILSIHAPILWFVAMLHREMSRHSGNFSILRTGRDLFFNLATNAIVLALILGSLWRMTHIGLHPIADRMLSMLGDAGVPTALFALGLSLAGYSLKGAWSGTFALLGLKMVFMPLVVFLLVRFTIELPPLWARLAVLFAAMPTGANAFIFATKYDESVPPISGAVTLGTAFAAITATLLLWLMDANLI